MLVLTSPRLAFACLPVLWIAWGLRLFRLADANVWWDEGWSIWMARKPFLEAALKTAADPHPPLYYWLLRAWIAAAGDSQFAMRILTVALALLAVAVTVRLGSALLGPGAGRLAGLLLALARFHLWWSQEIRMYSLAVLMATCSLLFFTWAWRSGGWRWWLAHALALTLGLFSMYLTGLVVAVEAAFVALCMALSGARARAAAVRWLASLGAAWGLLLPWAWLVARHHVSWSSRPSADAWLFARAYWTVLNTGVADNIERVTPVVLAPLAVPVLAIVLAIRPSGEPRLHPWRLLLLAVAFPPALIYLLSLPTRMAVFIPALEARYLVVMLPAYLVMVAGLIAWLLPWRRLAGLAAGAGWIALALWVLPPYYQQRYPRDEFNSLAAYIGDFQAPGDGILLDSDHDWPVFAYYYVAGLPWYGVPASVAGSPVDTARLLQPLLEQHQSLWLVRDRQALVSDPQRYIERWLGEHSHKVGAASLGEREVSLYSTQPGRNIEIVRQLHPGAGRLTRPPLPGLAAFGQPLRTYVTAESIGLVTYWDGPAEAASYQLALIGPVAAQLPVAELRLPAAASPGLRRVESSVAVRRAFPAGSYRFRLGDGRQGLDFGGLRIRQLPAPPMPPIERQVAYELGDDLLLIGYSGLPASLQAGAPVDVTLFWQARRDPAVSRVVFVHLLGAQANPRSGNPLWGQRDSLPLDGAYPTSSWSAGETVADRYRFSSDPSAPAGEYHLEVGMYDPLSGKRVPVRNANGAPLPDDRVLLGPIRVTRD